ncbi:MAG: N-ethylammeline chlorohydrolase [Clostridiaceae bacterium BRH_c20a]|nr:MAG: N-ethylammeline chlorohydrolase [Clostridiaceae bacterium BRH_c20a]
MAKQILIKNTNILAMTENSGSEAIIGDILIEGQYIKKVGQINDYEQDIEIINGNNCAALPGLVNCHTHGAMTLLRGYADDMELMPWLEQKIWPREAKLDAEHIYWGSMLAILEMLKTGTTTFADMYFFMNKVAEAVEESGIRAVLARGMIGFNDKANTTLKEAKEFIPAWQGAGKGRITCMLGPHAPYTCPPEYLTKVLELAYELKVGIHIHLAETKKEFTDIRKQYGKTPIKHVYDLGLFNVPVLAAHCVHLTEEDIDILQEVKAGIAHNPTSNMKLASGMAPIPQLLEAGVKVGLGTDGTASNNNLNMMEEMHIASLLHKVSWGDPTVMPAYQVLQMGTVFGAGAVNLIDEIGTIEEGKKADVILVDLDKPHLYPCHDIVANLIYSAQGSDVKTSIIDGQIVMKDREVLTIDEEKVKFEAKRYAQMMLL